MNKAQNLWLLLNKFEREETIHDFPFPEEVKKYPFFYLLNWFNQTDHESQRKISLQSTNRINFYHSVKDAPSRANSTKSAGNSQVELIDLFLKKLPSIPKQTKNQESEMIDLAEIQEENYEYPISETFAKILIKQEKISDAIKIYEQLILKMPEKKVYFASQIELLKNKLK